MANSISGLNKTIKTANNRKIKDLTPVSTLPMETVRELPRPPEKQPAVIVPPTAPGAQRTVTGSAAPAQTTQAAPSGTSGASSGTGSESGVSAPKSTVEPVDFIAPMPDAQAARRYEQAASALEGLRGQKPDYTSRYDDEITSLYEQLRGRGPFRYDSATDPLYQQYVQDYTRQGQMAMRDTMGQAAALTGGYGSSYAQSVGQQQYDAYLQRLADILPETYGMALDAYRAEGEGLSDKLRTAQTLEKSDYERYLDELGQYNRELDRADAADRGRVSTRRGGAGASRAEPGAGRCAAGGGHGGSFRIRRQQRRQEFLPQHCCRRAEERHAEQGNGQKQDHYRFAQAALRDEGGWRGRRRETEQDLIHRCGGPPSTLPRIPFPALA